MELINDVAQRPCLLVYLVIPNQISGGNDVNELIGISMTAGNTNIMDVFDR